MIVSRVQADFQRDDPQPRRLVSGPTLIDFTGKRRKVASMQRLTRNRAAALTGFLLLATLLIAGCASGTKSAGTAKHQITIVMQVTNNPEPNAEYFSSQVQKLSHGRIQIVLESSAYSSVDSRNEPRLVRALRSGKVQIAYIPSRAWEEASPVTAFRALEAPLLVTSYPLLRRITTGPIGRSMLASLNSIGIVGLGLVPERLRRLLGVKPLDSAATLRRKRIRPPTSPTGELALRALGAVPVTIANSRAAGPAMAHGRIEGVESETVSIEDNSYTDYAHYLTANIALFAKATTLAIRKSAFDSLSARDRWILRAAAEATVVHADPAAAERLDMKALCQQRIKLVTATPADLASLEPLALSAYSTLERDATTRRQINAIQKLKQTVPSSVSTIPPCPANSATKAGSPRFPLTGTYVMSATQSEVQNGPPGTQNPNNNYGAFRLVFHGGRFRLTDQLPHGGRVLKGFSAGTYEIQGDRIKFTDTQSDPCGASSICQPVTRPIGGPGDQPVICRWNVYRGALTFQQLPAAAQPTASAQGLDPVGPPLLYIKPWRPVT
jgi:TRAP-type C4-dicarboxylate transport system substrate-binding protein